MSRPAERLEGTGRIDSLHVTGVGTRHTPQGFPLSGAAIMFVLALARITTTR